MHKKTGDKLSNITVLPFETKACMINSSDEFKEKQSEKGCTAYFDAERSDVFKRQKHLMN